jgi:hypothetical protein
MNFEFYMVRRAPMNPYMRVGAALFSAGLGCAFYGPDPFVPYMIGIGFLIFICGVTMQPPRRLYYYDEKGRRRRSRYG